MSGFEFLAIWVAWIIAGGSPGPATMGIAGTSMNEGRRLGLVFALGILAGSAFWGIAAALGMSALMLTNAWIFEVLRYVGAAYLMYLALKSLRSAMSDTPTLLRQGHKGAPSKVFLKGALIHLTNPKAILSWGAIYSIVVPIGAGTGAVFETFALLYAGSILVFLGYALMFSTGRVVRAYAAARRWFELTFAVLFGAAAIKIFTAKLT